MESSSPILHGSGSWVRALPTQGKENAVSRISNETIPKEPVEASSRLSQRKTVELKFNDDEVASSVSQVAVRRFKPLPPLPVKTDKVAQERISREESKIVLNTFKPLPSRSIAIAKSPSHLPRVPISKSDPLPAAPRPRQWVRVTKSDQNSPRNSSELSTSLIGVRRRSVEGIISEKLILLEDGLEGVPSDLSEFVKDLSDSYEKKIKELREAKVNAGVNISEVKRIEKEIKLLLDRKENLQNMKYNDFREKPSLNLIEKEHFIENLENAFQAVKSNNLKGIRDKTEERLRKIPINSDINHKDYTKDAKAACLEANQILGECFAAFASHLGIGHKDLERLVAKHNSESMGKTPIVTAYKMGDQEYFDVAEPRSGKMHTSADRDPENISNFYERSTYKRDSHGALTKVSSIQSSSSITTITLGKANLIRTEGARDRIRGGMNAFEQILSAQKPNTDGVIKISQTTLFTVARETLDKVARGLESEHLQLQETIEIYNLYDGQQVEINGKQVRVEIEHLNAGTNKYASNTMLLDQKFEKMINDKCMAKISQEMDQYLAKEDVPIELQMAREEVHKLCEESKEELSEIREKIKKAKSDQEFNQLRGEAKKINDKINNAYAKLAEVNKKVFYSTLEGEVAALKDPQTRAARQLFLEAQHLYYSGAYHNLEGLHHLQLAQSCLASLRGMNVMTNCKSGEDRTGRFCNMYELAQMTYDKFGVFPRFSDLLKGTDNATKFFNDSENHKRLHKFSSAAQINNQNNPGAASMQVDDAANPHLKGFANAGKVLACMAKEPYKVAGKWLSASDEDSDSSGISE